MAARGIEEVLKDHLRLRERGELEQDIRRNYAPDVVLLTPTGSFHGHQGVRDSAQLLYKAIQDPECYQYDSIVCDDRVALLEWSARTEEMSITGGVDSFLIEDGKILVQTIRYTVTFSDLSQAKSLA
ncbi:MAG: nuclear transport factor 2 family protein [Actinomycetota bacterium]|nr:nuclear transport factor 2 family protein [Actinomycetota bacterium]